MLFLFYSHVENDTLNLIESNLFDKESFGNGFVKIANCICCVRSGMFSENTILLLDQNMNLTCSSKEIIIFFYFIDLYQQC